MAACAPWTKAQTKRTAVEWPEEGQSCKSVNNFLESERGGDYLKKKIVCQKSLVINAFKKFCLQALHFSQNQSIFCFQFYDLL